MPERRLVAGVGGFVPSPGPPDVAASTRWHRWARGAGFVLLAVVGASLVGGCATKPPPTIARPVVRPPPPPAAVIPSPSTPAEVRAEIIRWFSVHGYKPFQAAALADHARAESGFRPCVDVGDRRYTFQWSGLRLRRLIADAGAGEACPPLNKQLTFADAELRQEANYYCFWQATTETEAFRALRRGFGRGRC
jgi:hypothetical protein